MNAAPVWVLLDDRPGNSSQSLGIAERLGAPFEVKQVDYNIWAKLPAAFQPAGLMTVSRGREGIVPPWPRLLIAAGRRLAPVARYIGRRSGHATRLVQLMDPGAHWDEFDLLVVPQHDGMLPHANMAEVVAPPHRLTHKGLSEAAALWRGRFAALPRPYIALIVGGNTKYGKMTPQAVGAMVSKVNFMAGQTGGSVLVTTSRRTPREAVDMLQKRLTAPSFQHHWTAGDKENPYLAYLALADAIVVTGDSMSMLAEACFTGVPVYIEDTGDNVADKHRRLHDVLVRTGYARAFNGRYDEYSYLPLDTARDVADEVRTRFLADLTARPAVY